ncbi:MAG: efflux RND transporter permease subunit, partial [Verrucomicrobia bacterium]|nr:efflux RND transporter permease subunit [Verrucomicrobiota bacterium]
VSFILMQHFGISSNIMSLSGIAIAIGVLVDAGIVMTENVIRHCEKAEEEKNNSKFKIQNSNEQDGGKPLNNEPSVRLTAQETWDVVLAASKQVGRPIFFAMMIIILAFIPVFALTGQEGKLFHPLAFTKTFAMIGSTLLAVTVVPALCAALVRGPFHSEDRNWIMRATLAVYNPVLDWALRRRKTVMSLAALLLASALIVAFGLPRFWLHSLEQHGWPNLARAAKGFGREFMPPLNEGSLLFMPVLLPSTSLTEVKRVMAWQDQIIRATPEVASVAGKLGRAETATDPAPVEMIETTIMLKPEFIPTNRVFLGFIKIPTTVRNPEWRVDMTPRLLVAEFTQKLTQVPGYVPGFLQPIENRILMLSTGIRAQVGVKILGDNLDELQRWAFEVEKVVREVPGAVGVAPSRVQGKPYLEIEVDRVAMARFGLRAADVLEVVEAGLGGRKVSTTIEGRERFPIQVRLERHERDDLERLGEVLVATPSGKMVPLGQVARIRRALGPSEIVSENGRLRVFVQANVQERDLGGFVKEIRERLDREIVPRLPKGMTIEYSGEYENMLRASRTLTFILPATILIIFLLLYLVYHSAKEAAHVILAVPFALTGGIFLQAWLGYNFSVAVWVGYIALFGTAIQTGVVMVVYLEEMVAKKRAERAAASQPFTREDLIQAIKDGARLRLRPKVMTVATIVASLLPIMWSERTGAEVMKPLATPVIGGMVSSLLHILIVTPVIFAILRERELK